MQRELFPQSPSERFSLLKLKDHFFEKLYIASNSTGKTPHLYKQQLLRPYCLDMT